MNSRNTGAQARRPAAARPRTGAVRRAPARTPGRPGAGTKRPAAPDRRWRLMQGGLLILLVIYTALVIGANAARDVALSVVSDRLAPALQFAGLEAGDENAFQERFGISPEGCEDWLLFGAGEIMNVAEVMIAKGDDATLSRLEEAARRRIDSQLAVFRGYGAEQTGLLERAALWRRGDYLFYGVGERLDQWEEVFLSCIR